MKITVNTNETVHFKPTEEAIKHYAALHQRFGLVLEVDDKGYCKMSLWTFMKDFGQLYCLGVEVPTISNELEFRGD